MTIAKDRHVGGLLPQSLPLSEADVHVAVEMSKSIVFLVVPIQSAYVLLHKGKIESQQQQACWAGKATQSTRKSKPIINGTESRRAKLRSRKGTTPKKGPTNGKNREAFSTLKGSDSDRAASQRKAARKRGRTVKGH